LHYLPYLWPAYKRRLIHSDTPILAGPFLGEAGLECLYWLSFLETLKQAGVKSERIIPIGRGGSAAWYGTQQGVETYAMRTPQQVRIETLVKRAKTGMTKQMVNTPFDRAIIRDAADNLGLKSYHTLHPSWMYQTLQPYWNGHRGLDWLHSRAMYGLLPPPALPEGMTVPDGDFVCVKFYFRSTFDYKQESLHLAKAVVKKLSDQSPVLILNTGVHADDHRDMEFKAMPNVYQLRDCLTLTPSNTLWAQSAAIARAQGFVGTYGGLAQLAQRFGKGAVTFYTQWGGTLMQHKHLSDAIALRTNIPFVVLQVQQLALLSIVLPMVVQQQPLTTSAH